VEKIGEIEIIENQCAKFLSVQYIRKMSCWNSKINRTYWCNYFIQFG